MRDIIIIEASDVWDYFQKHKKELEKEPYIIAERADYGVVITLSEERGLPYFIVTSDNYQYDELSAVSKHDCTVTVNELYDRYLTDNFFTLEFEDTKDDNLGLVNQDDAISERELELDDAILTFMETVIGEDVCYLDDSVCEDIKEHILEYIARKHGITIRRPMILEDKDDPIYSS